MLDKLKNEPVVLLVVGIAVLLTAMVLRGWFTIDDINNALDVFWRILALVVVAAGTVYARAKVTPTRKG